MIRMKYKPLPPTPSKYLWYWEPFEWEEEEVLTPRLIDANALIHEMDKEKAEALATAVTVSFDKPGEGLLCGLNMADKIYASAMLAVYSAPTIDAVPVVRCEDCKYWREETDHTCRKWGGASPRNANGYCDEAERSEE